MLVLTQMGSVKAPGPPIMKLPSYAGRLEDAITILDNDVYAIKDLFLRNSRGVIIHTVSATALHPRRNTTGHSHNENNELYIIFQGQGIINVEGEPFFVDPGVYVIVEKGRWHQVINTESTTDLVFVCSYPAEIRRPHLNLK